jgi:hemolysin activation/secretion protein
MIGASVDGTGFDRESLEATYRRHQLETPFGDWLNGPEELHRSSPIWRIDWASEVSTPGLHSDFDFRRHLLSGRTRLVLTEHQELGARLVGGWSGGVLPPQRQFAIGGIGSVHGYPFKEAVGDSLALVNLEYALGWRNRFQVVGFFDAGRVSPRPLQGIVEPAMNAPWLKGVGFGIGVAGARIDFGYRLDAVPSSLQVLLRLGRTF